MLSFGVKGGQGRQENFRGCFESDIGYNHASVFVFSFLFFYTDDVKESGFDISC